MYLSIICFCLVDDLLLIVQILQWKLFYLFHVQIQKKVC